MISLGLPLAPLSPELSEFTAYVRAEIDKAMMMPDYLRGATNEEQQEYWHRQYLATEQMRRLLAEITKQQLLLAPQGRGIIFRPEADAL